MLSILSFLFGLYVSLADAVSKCQITDQSIVAADGITIEYTEYLPPLLDGKIASELNRQLSTIIVMPPTGGVTVLDRRFSTKLCSTRQRVVLVKKWTGLNEPGQIDFEIHNRNFSRANRVIQSLVERFQGAASGQSQKLRLMGTSLGAQYSISALARLAVFDRAVLIVGGSPLSRVIANSNNTEMKILRDRRFTELKVPSIETYRQTLDSVFKWNDEEQIARISQRTQVLMVVGLEDDAVPTENQEHLEKVIRPARAIRIKADHIGTIMQAYFSHASEIVEFLTN